MSPSALLHGPSPLSLFPLPPRSRRRSSSMRSLWLLSMLCAMAIGALVSAQTLRIPLQRRDLPSQPNAAQTQTHPFRSLSDLSRQLASTPSHHSSHPTLNLAVNPASVVPLRNYYNRMYTGKVSVGTPANEYSLVFDTGSADMWLFAASAAATKFDYVKYYDRSASSTSKSLSTPWSIQYGKGSASGHLVMDRVQLADKATSQFTFAEATQWSDDFESRELPLDGLLGLAFSSVSSANALTLLDKLKEDGVISSRKFSFYLTDDPSNSGALGSEFILGEPDLTLAQGNITYMDVASTSGMWLLSMQGVNVGGAATSYCTQDCAVLVDTGTSFVGMPSSVFVDFARRIQSARSDCRIDAGSGLIRCDDDTTSNGLPMLSFSLQGNRFDLKGSDYFQGGVIGIMSIDVGTTSSFWILGDTFLKTYFTVFDMDSRKIGIAGAKPGLPYSPPTEERSPFRRFSWQLIVLLASIVLGICLVLSICIRCCGRSSSPRGRPAGAQELQSHRPSYSATEHQQPYVLQQAPPTSTDNFRSSFPGNAPMQGQPRTLGAQHAAATRPPGNSQFARDFYAVRA